MPLHRFPLSRIPARWRFVLVPLLLLCAATLLTKPAAVAAGSFLVRDDHRAEAMAAVVLAGDFPDRTLEAAMLYHQGKATHIYFTNEPPAPAIAMLDAWGIMPASTWERNRALMRRLGIPGDAISLIPGDVLSTGDEAVRISAFAAANKMERLRIVTSRYHSRRACWVMERAINGAQIYCSPSGFDRYNPYQWWETRKDTMRVFSEYVKFAGYLLETALGRKLAA